jgi:hypothetical protein
MDDYPVKVGTMLFTMVDPNKGNERAYNRWYERDHFYAGCMIGPWLFSGKRWVATRELKDLRFPEKSPFAEPVDAGSYLAIYWHLEGRHEEHDDWALPQVQWLYANGRGFAERTHAHTARYEIQTTEYSDPDGVPIDLALDHCYAGLAVVVAEPAAGVSRDELQQWIAANAAPALLKVEGVDNWSAWKHLPYVRKDGDASPMSLGTEGGSPDRLVQLCFLETDPRAVWDSFREFADTIDAGGKGKVTWAAPFFATKVGTDTYVDQLW